MVKFGSVSISSAVVVLALVILWSSTTDASGPGYGAPHPSPDTCVSPYLNTCIGDKATCQLYSFYKPGGYCPGKQSGYRRELSDEEESGYGDAPQVGLDKFMCPCKMTLQKYFDIVVKGSACGSASYGGGYGGGQNSGYGAGRSAGDYNCNRCPGTSCGSGGYYRNLDQERGLGYVAGGGGGYGGAGTAVGYGGAGQVRGGHVSGGYSSSGHASVGYASGGVGGYGKATCSCAAIEDAAIEKFCMDFVGDYRGGGGYGSGLSHGGYRKLEEEESYAPAQAQCSACVKDCIAYIKGCCSESICRGASTYGPAPGY